MPRFKADLHLHTIYDFLDRSVGTRGLLSPFDFIDIARDWGYQVLSFTHHGILFEDADVQEYARKQGILLIPGMECFINKKHVLLYNFMQREPLNSFADIRRYKNERNMVIAPHPFYPSKCCLQQDLIENIDCFDALEYSHYYTSFFNPNKKMIEVSEAFQLPVVGFSDTHCLEQFGSTYSLVDADEFSAEGIITAIKKGRVEVVSEPLTVWEFFKITLWFFTRYRFGSSHLRKNILSIPPGSVSEEKQARKAVENP